MPAQLQVLSLLALLLQKYKDWRVYTRKYTYLMRTQLQGHSIVCAAAAAAAKKKSVIFECLFSY